VDAVSKLYEAVDDHRLHWLDDLMISAGLLWRCACRAMVRTEGAQCTECGRVRGECSTAPQARNGGHST
jgi:hypothetical protein